MKSAKFGLFFDLLKKFTTSLDLESLGSIPVKSLNNLTNNCSSAPYSGKLVPLEEVLTLLRNAMEAKNSTSKGFLIDGYPREVDQAIQFEKNVCNCAFLFFFDVNDAVMVERLLERGKKSGRVDDNEETIKKRLDTFHTHTDPILKYFGDRVVKVNCARDVDSIFAEVCACIDAKCKT